MRDADAGASPAQSFNLSQTWIDALPGMSWAAGADGRTTFLNAALRDDLAQGLLPERWPVDAVHPDDRSEWWAAWNKHLSRAAPFDVEYRLQGRDGVYRWRRLQALPCRDADGTLLGWHGAVHDLEPLRRCEQQLAEAERQRNQFLAMLGHELRNPLATIVSALQVLETLDTEVGESLEMRQIIRRQANLLKRLVDDLLDVSRIARNKIVLQAERVDLVELVRDCVAEHRRAAEARGIQQTLVAPAGPLWCQADSHRLRQAIDNVLGNALKYNDSGGSVAVTLRADSAGDRATLQVVDTGIGMTPDMLGQLFSPFAQAETSLARSQGGLGLGLALAKGLIELHGGRITAESRGLQAGSSFTIEVPLLPGHSTSNPETGLQSVAGRALRVLVIEDRRDAAVPLLKLLRGAGHSVELSADGASGLEVAESFLPQVIICDVGLPGIDGYEVARRLRMHHALRDVFLVALTGYGLDSDRQQALAAGFDHHLRKPIDFAELRAVIEIALRADASNAR